MANEDETVWLVYNGEVYNYRELREELEAAGHVFRTHSDTEVIVHAYEEWGPACAARFNGMWAFAIADLRGAGEDGRGGKLVLNRDHFGIKPLYYARSPRSGRLLFASEIKALLQDPELVAEPDEQMIFEYLQHGFHDHRAETFFTGVYHVPAATWIEAPLDGLGEPADAAAVASGEGGPACSPPRWRAPPTGRRCSRETAATTPSTSGAASARASSGASSAKSPSARASPAAWTRRRSSAS